jgi:hypothetical protein
MRSRSCDANLGEALDISDEADRLTAPAAQY